MSDPTEIHLQNSPADAPALLEETAPEQQDQAAAAPADLEQKIVHDVEQIPRWAAELFRRVQELWNTGAEHHHRVEAVIGDLRKYGIPLGAVAAHYEAHGATIPPATASPTDNTEPAEAKPE
jgi:hypothetical protein